MGNAEFCPLCGDIVGGWDLPFQPHTCKGEPERQRMATEGGADLREVLAKYFCVVDNGEQKVKLWPEYTEDADAILGAMAEAGWVPVERGRLERVMRWAKEAQTMHQPMRATTTEDLDRMFAAFIALQPSDLDGPGGGAG